MLYAYVRFSHVHSAIVSLLLCFVIRLVGVELEFLR